MLIFFKCTTDGIQFCCMNVLTIVHVNPVSTDIHRKTVFKETSTEWWTGYWLHLYTQIRKDTLDLTMPPNM